MNDEISALKARIAELEGKQASPDANPPKEFPSEIQGAANILEFLFKANTAMPINQIIVQLGITENIAKCDLDMLMRTGLVARRENIFLIPDGLDPYSYEPTPAGTQLSRNALKLRK